MVTCLSAAFGPEFLGDRLYACILVLRYRSEANEAVCFLVWFGRLCAYISECIVPNLRYGGSSVASEPSCGRH